MRHRVVCVGQPDHRGAFDRGHRHEQSSIRRCDVETTAEMISFLRLTMVSSRRLDGRDSHDFTNRRVGTCGSAGFVGEPARPTCSGQGTISTVCCTARCSIVARP